MRRKNRVLLDNENNNDLLLSTNYEVFRQKIIRKAKKSISLFKAHSFSFISINAFLAFLNFITPGSYPWFLFPLGSMAMLLSLHYVSRNDRIRQKTDIEKYPVLTDRAFKLLKKIFRKRRFTKLSTMFTVSVSAFLFMVNIITGPGYLWAAIPAAALASLSGTIWFFNKQNKKELIKDFRLRAKENIFLSPTVSTGTDVIEVQKDYPALIEAYSLKESILKQLTQIGITEDPLIDTIPELVDSYILQIKALLEKINEFTGILNSYPYEKLIKEKKDITDRLNTADNAQLQSQYRTSLLELDNRLASSKKIANQNELFTLKTNSALNSIRMVHLDLANLNVEKMSHNDVMKVLEKESNILSERLADLQSSYSELEKEML